MEGGGEYYIFYFPFPVTTVGRMGKWVREFLYIISIFISLDVGGGALLPYTLYKEMLRKGADNEH